jgi:hypothetical protein
MRSIPVHWSLLGVVFIAIVVYGGTGLVHAAPPTISQLGKYT